MLAPDSIRLRSLQGSPDDGTLNLTLTYEVSHDGPGKIVIKRPSYLVECTMDAASTKPGPRIVSSVTDEDELNLPVEPGRPVRYNVTLTLIFTGTASSEWISIGAAGKTILGYKPGEGYQEPYRDEALKVVADLVGISWG